MLKILFRLIDNSMHTYTAHIQKLSARELKINWFVYITLKASFKQQMWN